MRWIKSQLSSYEFLTNLDTAAECFTNGQVFCCLINRYRPNLIDLTKLKGLNVEQCNEIAFSVIERELGISPSVTAAESVTLQGVDPKLWLNYLEQVCEVFRGEIPHVKQPKLDLEKLIETKKDAAAPDFSRLLKLKSQSKEMERSNPTERERPRRSRRFDTSAVSTPRTTPEAPSRRSRKHRSFEKFGNVVSSFHFLLSFLHNFQHFLQKNNNGANDKNRRSGQNVFKRLNLTDQNVKTNDAYNELNRLKTSTKVYICYKPDNFCAMSKMKIVHSRTIPYICTDNLPRNLKIVLRS